MRKKRASRKLCVPTPTSSSAWRRSPPWRISRATSSARKSARWSSCSSSAAMAQPGRRPWSPARRPGATTPVPAAAGRSIRSVTGRRRGRTRVSRLPSDPGVRADSAGSSVRSPDSMLRHGWLVSAQRRNKVKLRKWLRHARLASVYITGRRVTSEKPMVSMRNGSVSAQSVFVYTRIRLQWIWSQPSCGWEGADLRQRAHYGNPKGQSEVSKDRPEGAHHVVKLDLLVSSGPAVIRMRSAGFGPERTRFRERGRKRRPAPHQSPHLWVRFWYHERSGRHEFHDEPEW